MRVYQILCGVLLLFACRHEAPTEPINEPPVPQWAMLGKNLRHTANAADPMEYYVGPQQGKIVWSALKNFDGFWCTPSIGSDGTIYIASGSEYILADSGFIYAIKPNGTVKWQFRTQRPNYSTGALGQDGTYFYGSSDRYFYAIDYDGKLKWKRLMGYFNTDARPAITKTGEVIVAVGSGVTALHPENGNILWFYEKPMVGGFGVCIDNAGNIYTGTPTSLLALTFTGIKRWEFSVRFGPREILIAHDGTLYFQLESDSLFYALNPNGILKWTYKLPGETRNNNPCIGPDGGVYTVSVDDAKLYKLSSKGTKEAEIELVKVVKKNEFYISDSTPIIDKTGMIYLAISFTNADNFYAIKPNGELKWSVTIDNSGVFIFPKPAIAPDGSLYIAGDFTLNAIK